MVLWFPCPKPGGLRSWETPLSETQPRKDGAVFSPAATGSQIPSPEVTNASAPRALGKSLLCLFAYFLMVPCLRIVIYIPPIMGDAILLKFLRGLFSSRAFIGEKRKQVLI